MTTRLKISELRTPCGVFDLDIRQAECSTARLGIFGPSGSGKSTLLDLVAGLRKPLQGACYFGEHRFFETNKRHWMAPEKRRIGYVTQDDTLFPHLSVEGNLAFAKRHAASDIDSDSQDELIETLELREILHRAPRELSGGERRRVAIARALFRRPDLLLLDEPFAGFDNQRRQKTIDLLNGLQRKKNAPLMVLVSHHANEIMMCCDYVWMMERGQIIDHGAPSNLFEEAEIRVLRLKSRTR